MGHIQHRDGQGDRLTPVTAGTIQPGTVAAFALFLLVGLVIPALLVWRDIRQERRRLATEAPVGSYASFADYLRTLSDRLDLVPEQNELVCAEIEAHLWDTTEGLVAEGLDLSVAKRRAMEQLGPPTELAVALREARHERPRMLALVGGAAAQAGDGFIRGGCLGLLLILPFFVLVVGALGSLSALGFWFDDWQQSEEVQRILTATALAIGLAVGSRQGVVALARISRRPISGIARVWGLALPPLLAWAVVYGVVWQPAWPIVPFALALPVAVTMGALRDPRSWWRQITVRRRIAAILAVSLVVVFAEIVFARYEGGESTAGEVTNIEQVSPLAPAWSIPATTDYVARDGMKARCDDRGGVVMCAFSVRNHIIPDGQLSPAIEDLRIEVWPAGGVGMRPDGLDPRARAPVVTAPVLVTTDAVTGSVDIGMRRDGDKWWLVLTGVLPDGHRYRLTDGDGVQIPFKGTTLDWLNAPG